MTVENGQYGRDSFSHVWLGVYRVFSDTIILKASIGFLRGDGERINPDKEPLGRFMDW
jgi:hypothetical protein